jgi:hypothetical protein
MVINDSDGWQTLLAGGLLAWLTIEVVAIFIAYRIWGRFKRRLPIANRIFSTFGWRNPSGVDLPKASKRLKRPEDAWQMGKLVFRYVEH